MRKAVFVGVAVLVVSCTSNGFVSEKTIATIADSVVSPATEFDVDSIAVVLRKNGVLKDPETSAISIISDRVLDISEPSRPTNYLALLIESRFSKTTGIAILDRSKDMRLVGFLDQEFPDIITFVNSDTARDSGQGADLTPWPLKVSEAGDIIAVTARSSKQFLKGSNEDEDVWLFALWKNEVVMLMGYSQKYHHLISNNKGWSENEWVTNELSVASTKSNGMYDLVLNGRRKVFSETRSDNEEVNTFVKYIFNGKEYIRI